MILTVTLNPALDLTWQVDQIRLGRSHRVEKAAERAGGKGINVARILHNEGIPVMAVTTCGGMTGRIFRADIERSGVPHVLIDVAASTRRSAAIVSRTDGDTAIFNERGEPLSDDEVDRVCDSVIRRADADTVCVVSGSLPPLFSERRFASLLQDIRRSGALLIVDTSGSALEVAARAGAHLLKPNREELAEVTGTTDPVAGARALIAQGVKLVMVSLGGDGLLLVPASGEVLHARSVHPVRGNPTGAGDAVVAAAATALAKDVRLIGDGVDSSTAREAVARTCVAWSAGAVLLPLAGEISAGLVDPSTDVIVTTLEDVQ
jgi:1-phosphofructokinase family hexose kinase